MISKQLIRIALMLLKIDEIKNNAFDIRPGDSKMHNTCEKYHKLKIIKV
jgi:hypothetical protein